MSNFFNLCKNEFIKIFKKKTTLTFSLILIIGLFLCVFFMNYIIESNNFTPKEKIPDPVSLTKSFLEYTYEEIERDNINNIKITSTTKSFVYIYEYVLNNNIVLDHQFPKYWKFDVIDNNLRPLVEALYELEDKLPIDKVKIKEKENDIQSILTMLETEDYDGYLDMKKIQYNEGYNGNRFAVLDEIYQKAYLYMAELNRKYEVTRYNDEANQWKYTQMGQITNNALALFSADENTTPEEMKKLNDNLQISIYRLENKIFSNDYNLENYNDYFLVISRTFSLLILGLFIIIIGASSISSEFSKGTIKQLFMTPNKKWKILLSKILVLTLILIVSSIILSLITQLFGNIFYSEHIASPYIYIVNGQVHTLNSFAYNILLFLVMDIRIFVYMLFSVFLSTSIKSSALAIGISTLIYSAENMFMQFVNTIINNEWIKFIPFNNLNLAEKVFSSNNYYYSKIPNSTNVNEFINRISLNFSAWFIICLCILFISLTFISFRKKQIP